MLKSIVVADKASAAIIQSFLLNLIDLMFHKISLAHNCSIKIAYGVLYIDNIHSLGVHKALLQENKF